MDRAGARSAVGRRASGVRRAPGCALALLLAMLICIAVQVAPPTGAGADAPPKESTVQGQIRRAFGHLSPAPSVSTGRNYLQGYDVAMRIALLIVLDRLQSGISEPAKVGIRVGAVGLTSRSSARVPLTIEIRGEPPPSSYSETYEAAAVRQGGRWRVSWTTLCLLVESSRAACPPTPSGVTAVQPLPYARNGAMGAEALTPGLVSPGALAMAPGGGVLIADDGRDQILRWSSGSLTVVAGNTMVGFSGDGGPATQAALNDPGEISVGPDGTVYFVDSGNNRVRAIAPDGDISTVAGTGVRGNSGDGGPATRADINPSGLAVSPDGTLYLASGSEIRAVDPDGIIHTLVTGGPPAGVDVSVDGTPTAFIPGSMALDGQGDLLVFSFSPKLLFQVTPGGAVTEIGPNYASALSPVPDGSVLVAEHGAGVERVTAAAVAPAFGSSETRKGGSTYGLLADGVAEAPDGTIYVDTEADDGFSDHSALYAITAGDVVRPLTVSTPVQSTLPPVGAPGFPASIYPPAQPPRAGAALSECPSSQDLMPFDRKALAAARQLVLAWGSNLGEELLGSDRAWWTGVITRFSGLGPAGSEVIDSTVSAGRDLYAPVVARACGTALLRDSIVAVIGPSTYSFAVLHLYMLDRGGTPLVYYMNF